MYKYIYKICSYKSNRHFKPHSIMYVSDHNDFYHIFDTENYKNNLIKIFYIRVKSDSIEYNLALDNRLINT